MTMADFDPRMEVCSLRPTSGFYFAIGAMTNDVIDVYVTIDWHGDTLNSTLCMARRGEHRIATIEELDDDYIAELHEERVSTTGIDFDRLAVAIRRWWDAKGAKS